MVYSDMAEEMKKQKHCKKIQTNSLIALCEMENYDNFCQELEALIASNKNKNLIKKVYDIIQEKPTFGNKKLKIFVKKYQDIIEIMKKYDCLIPMTIFKYEPNGKPYKLSNEEYFFKFISEHKEDIETIKNIAIKIKNLGFDEIIYGENLDFTENEYELIALGGFYIKFLDNIEVVPKYNYDRIRYKTNDSSYCIEVKINGYGKDKRISEGLRRIELNSLIFDPERLPNEITFESTVGTIIKLAEDSKKDNQIIKDTVDMSVSVEDLIIQYNNTKKIIESIENVKNKEEIKQILNNILSEITKLKSASLSFEKETVDSFPKISEDKIEDEKKLYLRIRESTDLD